MAWSRSSYANELFQTKLADKQSNEAAVRMRTADNLQPLKNGCLVATVYPSDSLSVGSLVACAGLTKRTTQPVQQTAERARTAQHFPRTAKVVATLSSVGISSQNTDGWLSSLVPDGVVLLFTEGKTNLALGKLSYGAFYNLQFVKCNVKCSV